MEPEPHQQHRPHHAQDSLEASESGARAASITSSQLSALSSAMQNLPGQVLCSMDPVACISLDTPLDNYEAMLDSRDGLSQSGELVQNYKSLEG